MPRAIPTPALRAFPSGCWAVPEVLKTPHVTSVPDWCKRPESTRRNIEAMAQVHLTILVHEDWRDRYSLVLEHCRQAGLTVERELVAMGAIVGSIEEDRVAALACVEGVSAVEPERMNRGLDLE